MKKVTKKILGITTDAIINNQKETGKILAILTYVDRQQICFLRPEQKLGDWILPSSLVDFENLATEVTENPQRIELETKQPEKKQADNDIMLLVDYAKNIHQSIANKVGSDLELISKTIKETQQLAEDTTNTIVQVGKNNIVLSNQLLNQLTENIGQILGNIVDTITKYWNKYWLQRVVSILEKLADAELAKAKQQVIDLQKENLEYQPSRIAQELITEKALFATATGLIVDGVKIVNPTLATMIDLTKNVGLLAEMIYQIGIAYGFEAMEDGEILAILALAFTGEKLRTLGLQILTQQIPIVNVMISAASNIALFELVGFTACQYYEAKVNQQANPLTSRQAYLKLEQQADTYLAELLGNKEKLQEVVVVAETLV